jgi:flagellar biosynthesis regulator FlaF
MSNEERATLASAGNFILSQQNKIFTKQSANIFNPLLIFY